MRSRKTDRLTMESELRRAISEEIKVLYQPIVRLEDRAIAGFEALARWDHPKLGRCRRRNSYRSPRKSG
jgi:sensor c-di-GMP phosphodiesterase-like protein